MIEALIEGAADIDNAGFPEHGTPDRFVRPFSPIHLLSGTRLINHTKIRALLVPAVREQLLGVRVR